MTVFPVIASTLSAKALGEFAKDKYGLNENYTCKLFRTGMNHTYFLSDNTTKYALRVYSHNWRSKAEIIEELKLLNELHDKNLGVSFPIPDTTGNYIQEIHAPEGLRYVVLFSFAEGGKVRFMDHEMCFEIGSQMAKFHKLTANKTIDRVAYTKATLTEGPYEQLKAYFPEALPEMKFIKTFGQSFENSDFDNISKGVVHMDIWYDNMAIQHTNQITFFDFDFCGNGALILDVGYFCKQLFFIESDKAQYELKVQSFLKGYQKFKALSDQELKLIPKSGASVYVFYLGIQALRFDWSNIFLTENYLKMFVGRIQSWLDYYETKDITVDNHQLK